LVEVSPNAKPPVCKICDYGKFNFERHKKEKLQKKHQSVMTIKEIRFSANTDKHDTEFKCRHLKQFLLDGHKIKVTVIYKGRMITHPEIGQKLMEEILSKILEVGKLESSPRMEGKFFIAYLIPDKNKITAYKEKLKHLNESEQNIKPEAKKAAVQKPIEEKVNIDGKIEMNTEAKENIEEKN
jgi:translation initiation factor IF-3